MAYSVAPPFVLEKIEPDQSRLTIHIQNFANATTNVLTRFYVHKIKG